MSLRYVAAFVSALCLAPLGRAQTPAPEARRQEQVDAWRAGNQAATKGPAVVHLRDQGEMDLPANMEFVPAAEAVRIQRANGGSDDPNLLGLVTALDDTNWIVIVRYVAEGHVRDDEAKDFNADDMLANLRESQAAANKERAERGFPGLALLGWAQPPSYDATAHQLVWSVRVQDIDTDDKSVSANLDTRVLGREGYLSLKLVTDETEVAKDRKAAAPLLANVHFLDGKRYADFNESTDRVAEYGLAALIGVVAAKKIGLLALAGAFVLKFAKIGAVAVAGGAAVVARLFKRRKTTV